MKILQVILSFPPATAQAGPAEQVGRLSVEMRRMGHDVRVITTDQNGMHRLDVPADRWSAWEGVPVFYGKTPLARVPLSRGADREIARVVREFDLVHLSTVYLWATIVAARAARRAGVPYVVSPRGCFDPSALKFSAWKKRLFSAAGGTTAFSSAAALHATSARERGQLEAHVPGVPTFVVPNGVEIPAETDLAGWKGSGPSRADVVYLGRIHPIKNLPALLAAWERVGGRHAGGRLIVAGPDDKGHRAEVEAVAARLGLGGRVEFPGPMAGEAKSRLLARARCLILPSLTENFGNVVGEALSHGTPVVASTGTPWEGLPEHGCGFWVGCDVHSLSNALEAVLSADDATIEQMGSRGRAWMISEFGWPAIGAALARAYEAVLSRNGRR